MLMDSDGMHPLSKVSTFQFVYLVSDSYLRHTNEKKRYGRKRVETKQRETKIPNEYRVI